MFVLAPADRRAPLSCCRMGLAIHVLHWGRKIRGRVSGITSVFPSLLPWPLWGSARQRDDLKMEVVQRVIDLNHKTITSHLRGEGFWGYTDGTLLHKGLGRFLVTAHSLAKKPSVSREDQICNSKYSFFFPTKLCYPNLKKLCLPLCYNYAANINYQFIQSSSN